MCVCGGEGGRGPSFPSLELPLSGGEGEGGRGGREGGREGRREGGREGGEGGRERGRERERERDCVCATQADADEVCTILREAFQLVYTEATLQQLNESITAGERASIAMATKRSNFIVEHSK